MKVTEPTIGEIISILSTFPSETPFRIRDPDTDWTIETFYIDLEKDNILWISANYEDMKGPEDL